MTGQAHRDSCGEELTEAGGPGHSALVFTPLCSPALSDSWPPVMVPGWPGQRITAMPGKPAYLTCLVIPGVPALTT